jgi:Protein of unknown function (DUF2793)
MMANQEVRSGLYYGWALGESGWNGQMDANLVTIGRFGMHLSVKDRDLTTPPSSPASGDTYIAAAGSTDSWAGQDDKVIIWTGSAWAIGTPRVGWVAYIEDEQKLTVYKAGGWSEGIAI